MSLDWYQDVKNFHKEVINDDFKTTPHIPTENYKKLRKKLIEEEIKETLDALDSDDLVELADGIVDSIVVLLGTAITYGIDIRDVWNEVHKTNMAKKDGPVRADGKKLKPINWKAPDVKTILLKQGLE